MLAAQILAWFITVYAAMGLLFGLAFVTVGIQRVDSEAKGASWGFRLIILPGVAGLWPLLLMRWIVGSGEPPVERNSHRDQARLRGRS